MSTRIDFIHSKGDKSLILHQIDSSPLITFSFIQTLGNQPYMHEALKVKK